MARSIRDDEAPPPRIGHSSTPLTREEKAALKNHHIQKLLKGAAKIETVRGPFDEARVEHKAQFDQAKADLGKGYSRKVLQRLMDKVSSTNRDLVKEEARRFEDHVDLSIPVFGTQTDFFDGKGATMAQEAKDELQWEAEGFLVGRRAEERRAPKDCPPRMDQPFLRGYDLGLAEAAAQFTKGGEIIAARDAPPPEPKEEPEPADEQKAIAKSARKLKDSGFLAVVPKGDEAMASA